jgi:hypothetical protein
MNKTVPFSAQEEIVALKKEVERNNRVLWQLISWIAYSNNGGISRSEAMDLLEDLDKPLT